MIEIETVTAAEGTIETGTVNATSTAMIIRNANATAEKITIKVVIAEDIATATNETTMEGP
jgi:hypothetical protein